MFADSISTNLVQRDNSRFTVAVASTVARNYDRTFGVEVVDAGSNAIEGKHYRLLTSSVTIPAGKLAADVEVEGIYNYTNEGAISWYDFACAIVEIAGHNCRVVPCTTAEYGAKAARPAYSVLDKTKIRGVIHREIPEWRASLEECIKRMAQL